MEKVWVFIKLDEESLKMERLDVGCVLMAIHVDLKLDRIMKVRIGEGLFNVRLDGEWWPKNNSDDSEESLLVEEEDYVTSSLGPLSCVQTKNIGGFKKQDKSIGEGDHSPSHCEGGSAGVEEEEQLFTKMDKSSIVEVMDIWIENQKKREVEEVDRLGEAGEEIERLRKGKGIVKGFEEDDGFSLQIGPKCSLPSPNQFILEEKLKRHMSAHVVTNHVLSKEMQNKVKKVPELGQQEVAQLLVLEVSYQKRAPNKSITLLMWIWSLIFYPKQLL
ncbi:hypothetical protein TanjilG_14272 [Lupinus angustifolius]|uniref:Uncharacterized protein n=1 Tax=Lupinus angustifolius TaxID=3871 RepID=A0A1J7I6R0_LUPAN|nr:hypothetical protein TanjilG_14272 [Lupinus angustifolius]